MIRRILNKRQWKKKKNMRVIQSLNRNKVKVKKVASFLHKFFAHLHSTMEYQACGVWRKVKNFWDTVAVKEFLF